MEFKKQFANEIEDYKPHVEVDTPDFDFLTPEERKILKENLIADRIAYVVHHSLEDKKEPTSKTRKNIFYYSWNTFYFPKIYERYSSQSNPLLTTLNLKDL
jgi:hypothetical protein